MGFDISFGGAALAGLLSFFSPCILPIVPFYLSYMAGLSMQELRGEDGGPALAPGAQRRLIFSAVAFALGVTTIFVLLGLGATALGSAFIQWKSQLAWVAAAILFTFGLHFLGRISFHRFGIHFDFEFKIDLLYREARVEAKTDPSSMIGAYAMGLAFGFGWTPCVGPALAAILFMASGTGDLWQGSMLLLVYGLSMTLPFVVAAALARPFLGWVGRNRKLMGYVEKAMGAMLIIFAVLIATNSINIIAQWMIDNFSWSTLQ